MDHISSREKLIPLVFNNTLNHKNLPVYGDGLNIRDWLYVEDHCKGIDMVINGGRLGEVYNIGGHNERTNIFIVKTIIDYVKNNIDDKVGEYMITYVKDRKGHDRRYGIDPEKIKNELGWYPETTFEEGIKLTLNWYHTHGNWIEHITNGKYQDYYKEMYEGR